MRRGSLIYKDKELHSADPPSHFGGVGDISAGATTTEAGALSGFINPPTQEVGTTCWDVVAGNGDALSDLRELLEEVDDNAAMRACAVLKALDVVRDALQVYPETEDLTEPVALPLQTVALLARTLLQRLR